MSIHQVPEWVFGFARGFIDHMLIAGEQVGRVSQLLFNIEKTVIEQSAWILPLLVLYVGSKVIVHLLRAIGLFHPSHYRFVPRLPWRTAVEPIFRIEEWRAKRRMGKEENERWSGPFRTLATLYGPGKFFLGRATLFDFGWFSPVGKKLSSHAMLIADTGYGKTSSLISMLALHKGSAFVIDPKGELATTCFNRCGKGAPGIIGKGGKSFTLDPTGRVAGIESSRWNPFDHLHDIEDRYGRKVVSEAAVTMADALVVNDSQTQPIFSEAAREFMSALILHVYSTEPRINQTPARLYDLLTNGVKDKLSTGPNAPLSPTARLIQLMDENREFTGIPSWSAVVRDALKRGNEGSFTSSAKNQCKWMGLERLVDVTDTGGVPDFSLFDLRDDLVTVFLVASVSDIQNKFSGWFRLLTVMLMNTYEIEPRKKSWTESLCIIDELPSLGEVPAFATSFPVMRGHGLQVVAITQDLSLLRGTYPNHWATMMSSADARIFLGTDDPETLEYLENKLGKHTLEDGRDRPIASSGDLNRFMKPGKGNAVVITSGDRAMRLKAPRYFKELPVYLYEPNPAETESEALGIGRWFSSAWIKGPKPPPPKVIGKPARPKQPTTLESAIGVSALARLTDGRIVTSEHPDGGPSLAVYAPKTLELISTIPMSDGVPQANAIAAVPRTSQVWFDAGTEIVCVDVTTGRLMKDRIELFRYKPGYRNHARGMMHYMLGDVPVIGRLFDHPKTVELQLSHLAISNDGEFMHAFVGVTDRNYRYKQHWMLNPLHLYSEKYPWYPNDAWGTAATFLSNGSYLTANEHGEIGFWDTHMFNTTYGRLLYFQPDGKGSYKPLPPIDAIAVHESSARVAVGTRVGTIHLLDLDTLEEHGEPLWPDFFRKPSDSSPRDPSLIDSSAVRAITFTDDGTGLLAIHRRGDIIRWSLSGEEGPTMRMIKRERHWRIKNIVEVKPGTLMAIQERINRDVSPSVLVVDSPGAHTSGAEASPEE